MCGIAGLWAPRLEPAQRLSLVTAMVDRLRHRGPSGTAAWDGEGLALGIARLAIVARHTPAAVLTNETDTLHAVVNGEIYNHQGLRQSLRRNGHEVASGPDTAVIPHLYEQEGAGFPNLLDGQFAVAVWDRGERRLTLARDRAGEKPLFVARDARGVAFASEPGALLALPWITRDPAPEALARYLAHGFFAGDDSAFAAIRQLPPGHVLEIGEGVERQTRYWRPWDGLAARGERAAATRVSEAPAATLLALENAVASRVPDEVPFGVFLSGGIDSGLVATLTRRVLGHSFPTFSLRMAHRGYDESSFAREVAKSIGADHHELTMDPASGEEALDRYAAHMDQPLGDPSVLPTWALARLAAQHVPVVLTGEGGDELFAGYPTYLGHRHARIADLLPGPLAATVMALARRFRPAHHHVTIAHLIGRFIATRGIDPFERHLRWFGTAAPDEALALLAPALRSGRPRAPTAHLRRWRASWRGPAWCGIRHPGLVAYQLLTSGSISPATCSPRWTAAAWRTAWNRAPVPAPVLVEFALALPGAPRSGRHDQSGRCARRRAACCPPTCWGGASRASRRPSPPGRAGRCACAWTKPSPTHVSRAPACSIPRRCARW
jgi:asparagine synthase (glutamine-hydrolysing)